MYKKKKSNCSSVDKVQLNSVDKLEADNKKQLVKLLRIWKKTPHLLNEFKPWI